MELWKCYSTHPSIKGTSFNILFTISILSSKFTAKHVDIKCPIIVQKNIPHNKKPSIGFRRRMAQIVLQFESVNKKDTLCLDLKWNLVVPDDNLIPKW